MNADTLNKNVQFTICMDYLHQYLLIGSCQSLQSEGITPVKVQLLQTNESYDKHSFYLIVQALPICSCPSTFPLDCKVTFEDSL